MNSADPNTEKLVKTQQVVDAGGPRKERLATTASDGERKKRTKAPSIQSVSQLLRRVYTGPSKRLKSKLSNKEASAMGDNARLGNSDREELLTLATMSDRLLDRTRQLMLFVVGLEPHVVRNVVKEQIHDFVGDVLRNHPAYQTSSLVGVLENLPRTPREVDSAIQELISQDFSSFSWSSDADPLKKREIELCKGNVVHCLLLWFRARRPISIDQIQRHIDEGLWKPTARRHKTEVEKLHALMDTRDYSAASIACALLEEQLLEGSYRAEAAVRGEERAITRVRELEIHVVAIQAQLTESRAEFERLKKRVAEEVREHSNDRAHMQDEYEKLRGQVLRRLKEELSLLDEGLHALHRKPPKVYVMVDHAERAIDGLKGELKRLRGIDN